MPSSLRKGDEHENCTLRPASCVRILLVFPSLTDPDFCKRGRELTMQRAGLSSILRPAPEFSGGADTGAMHPQGTGGQSPLPVASDFVTGSDRPAASVHLHSGDHA